jgi:hypothetical protein
VHVSSLLMLDAGMCSCHLGKSVLCEKPFATNGEEVAEMYAAADAAGVLLQEGMWTRFFPATEHARTALVEGAIGSPRVLQSTFSDRCCEPKLSLLMLKWLLSASVFLVSSLVITVLIDNQSTSLSDPSQAAPMVFGTSGYPIVATVGGGEPRPHSGGSATLVYPCGGVASVTVPSGGEFLLVNIVACVQSTA